MNKPNLHEYLAQRTTLTASGCLEFTGHRDAYGYGRIKVPGDQTYGAHRIAWSLANSEDIPPGMLVLHSCDNPPCCNADHLRLGTHRDNMDDMVRRQRVRGESNPHARLRQADVDEIRRQATIGRHDLLIAQDFGVSRSLVRAIRQGKRWAAAS